MFTLLFTLFRQFLRNLGETYTMASFAIIYRKDKLNTKGEAPIHFRIIKDRRTRYISSGVKVHQKYWDTKRNKVKSSFPNSARLNNYISTKFAELESKMLEAETKGDVENSSQLKNYLKGQKSASFFPFAEKFAQKYFEQGKLSTYDKSISILSRLKEYGGSNLLFAEITPQYLEGYEDYLRNEFKNKSSTIRACMKLIQRVFNHAYRQGVIPLSRNPFLLYKKPPEANAPKEHLTEAELEQFIKVPLPEDSLQKVHQNIFIFSCYAGGPRISDLLTLKWKDYDGDYIYFTTNKTDTQLSIFLPDKAKEIIEEYRHPKNQKTDFLFPILNNLLDMENLRAVGKAINSATVLMNKSLKVIAERADVSKKVTTHIARHTWATRALRKGISIDKVSKILGHASVKQTQVYAKIVNEELDKAMLVFND